MRDERPWLAFTSERGKRRVECDAAAIGMVIEWAQLDFADKSKDLARYAATKICFYGGQDVVVDQTFDEVMEAIAKAKGWTE